jgi:gas vesicle protein
MPKDNTPRTILTFVFGAAVGAVAALLFAPKVGEELRDDIGEAVNDGVHHLNRKGKGLMQEAQKLVELAQGHVEDAMVAGENAYNRAKNA